MANYPRIGQRLAPVLLRQELAIPATVMRTDGREETVQLCDLDETAWARFDAGACDMLGRQIIQRITMIITTATLSDSRRQYGMFVQKLPPLPPGVTLMDLDLEEATVATLQKEGLYNDPDTLAAMTVRDLTMIPRFGARRLIDLLTAIEAAGRLPGAASDESLAAPDGDWIAALAARPAWRNIHHRDPRLGWQLRSIDAQTRTLGELLEKLGGGPSPDAALSARLGRLARALQGLEQLSLEEELLSVTRNCAVKPRHAELLIRLRGWDGMGEDTLQAVGDRHGLTRERVRQITTLAAEAMAGLRPYMPRLTAVLALADAMAPAPAREVEAAVLAQGLSQRPFRIEGALNAATLFGIPCPLALAESQGVRFVSREGLEALAETAQSVAVRQIEQFGADRIDNVAAVVSQRMGKVVSVREVQQALAVNPQFRLLDAEGGWYWLADIRRSRVMAHIEKIFCVCEELGVGELLEGIMRSARNQDTALPKKVLLELCRQTGWLDVVNNHTIRRRQQPDAARVLSESEQIIAAVLRAHGNILSWSELKNRCLAQGMVKVTYDVTIMNSPAFKRVAKGTYALRGAEVTSATLAECLARSQGFRPTRSKPEVGQTPDGRLYIVFRVTEYLLKSGLVFVPSVFRSRITHGRYGLVDGQGNTLGTLSCYNGTNLYGVRKYLGAFRLRENESFRLTFDVDRREAVMERYRPATARERRPAALV